MLPSIHSSLLFFIIGVRVGEGGGVCTVLVLETCGLVLETCEYVLETSLLTLEVIVSALGTSLPLEVSPTLEDSGTLKASIAFCASIYLRNLYITLLHATWPLCRMSCVSSGCHTILMYDCL